MAGIARQADGLNVSEPTPPQTGNGTKQLPGLPFFTQPHGPSVNTTRIIEAIIIAGLSSLCTSIAMVPRLEERINAQDRQIQELRIEVQSMRRDFYVPFGRPTRDTASMMGPSNGN